MGFFLGRECKLPLPPMLMFDRIKIEDKIGDFKKGYIEAELDIKDDLGFLNAIFKMILLCLAV